MKLKLQAYYPNPPPHLRFWEVAPPPRPFFCVIFAGQYILIYEVGPPNTFSKTMLRPYDLL